MLRLLATLVSLLAAPFGVTLSSPTVTDPPATTHDDAVLMPTPVSSEPPRPYTVVLDASAMPGEDGWFLIPLTATRAVSVDVAHKMKQTYDPGALQAAALLVGGPDGTRADATMGNAWRDAEANVDGERVACCQSATSRTPFAGSGAIGMSGGGSVFLDEGEVMHVGLVATGWLDGSKAKFTVTSWGAPLLVGTPVTGREVELVDLVDEARREGVNARFSGQRLAGSAGEASRDWTPAGTALLLFDAYASGNAGARVSVGLPTGALHRGEDLHEESLGVRSFTRGGHVTLRLTDLREPGPVLFDQSEYGYVQARALYADLSVPLTGFEAWHDANVREDDEDW